MLTNNKCVFLDLTGKTIFEQLQLEEALLRNCSHNVCLINTLSPEAVVLGISRSPQEDLYIPSLREDRVPIIKRYSGGGTVFVDHNSLFVTWIMNSPNTIASSQDIMHWSYEIYAPILPDTFAINENDYTFGEKKFAGNAQYIQRNRWVHHTTFLWEINMEKLLRYLPMPNKQPNYRQKRSHQNFLTTIRPYFPKKEMFFEELYKSTSRIFDWETLSEQELNDILTSPHRKSTTLI